MSGVGGSVRTACQSELIVMLPMGMVVEAGFSCSSSTVAASSRPAEAAAAERRGRTDGGGMFLSAPDLENAIVLHFISGMNVQTLSKVVMMFESFSPRR